MMLRLRVACPLAKRDLEVAILCSDCMLSKHWSTWLEAEGAGQRCLSCWSGAFLPVKFLGRFFFAA